MDAVSIRLWQIWRFSNKMSRNRHGWRSCRRWENVHLKSPRCLCLHPTDKHLSLIGILNFSFIHCKTIKVRLLLCVFDDSGRLCERSRHRFGGFVNLCILRRMMRHLELGPGCDSITMYRLLNLEALMIRPVNVVNAHAPKGTITKIPVLTSATLANF